MQVNISGNIPLDRLKEYAEDLQDEIEGVARNYAGGV
jgi:hypothetical protein